MADRELGHMDFIGMVSARDLHELERKERTYRGSWKRRGGVGAFMMLARKWDRIESMLSAPSRIVNRSRLPGNLPNITINKFDIFDHIEADPGGSDGTVLAEIRDLRCYLLLVEAEMVARGVVPRPSQLGSGLGASAGVTSAGGAGAGGAGAGGSNWAQRSTAAYIEYTTPGTPDDGGHHGAADVCPECECTIRPEGRSMHAVTCSHWTADK